MSEQHERAHEPLWIVAHDFGAGGDAAADLALRDLMNSRRGGRIVLMHEAPRASDATRVEAARALERVAERLRSLEKERFGRATQPIEIEAIVVDAIDTHGAERLVVGRFGSIAKKAKVPVLVARAQPSA